MFLVQAELRYEDLLIKLGPLKSRDLKKQIALSNAVLSIMVGNIGTYYNERTLDLLPLNTHFR